MKKESLLLLLLISFIGLKAQEKKERSKDTVKTEVVNVITTYNPKIADANKIQRTPEIKLSAKSKKKQLKYTIFSVPVASTFIPKTGVIKGIDVGLKEIVYKNYIAGGYGNYKTKFVEADLRYSTSYENEIGLYAKYLSSNENVKNTVLPSTFSNFNSSLFYRQKERYFDWKITLNSAQQKYNWYGVPESLKQNSVVNTINSEQKYNSFQAIGAFEFEDFFVEKSTLSVSYFSDAYLSSEMVTQLTTNFEFPLDFLSYDLNALSVDTKIETLKGFFKKNPIDNSEIDYTIVTAKIHPTYNVTFSDFSIKAGLKLFASVDIENSITNVLAYPDVQVSTPILKDAVTIYTGISGDLKTNTFSGFTEENPYVSPNLFMTQTSEKMNIFLGTSGKMNNIFSFNLKVSYKEEEDKPLFLRNKSNFNGSNSIANNNPLADYEYGNSFKVVYDNVVTTSILGEFQYDITNKMNTGVTFQYASYELETQKEAWNLPELQIAVFGKYTTDKWYASTNIYYVGERKIVPYTESFPFNSSSENSLDAFVDFNINGGYHLNNQFSVFLKLNNVLNTNYQRFSNFDVQGFQALGGITYKFDF